MVRNMLLQEAIDQKAPKTQDTAAIVADIKKTMNTAKLTKFKSQSVCGQFYSKFFLSTLPEANPDVAGWTKVYTELLSVDTFCEDLSRFMLGYQPSSFAGIFAPLWNKVQLELSEMKENRVRYLSLTKVFFSMLQMRMDGIRQMLQNQVGNVTTMKFPTVVSTTLQQMVMDLDKMIQDEVIKDTDPDDIVIVNRIHGNKLSEDAIELIGLFREAGSYFRGALDEAASVPDIDPNEMDEGIVRNAAMKAKEAAVNIKKAERDFNQLVMQKVKKMREERRNRKHSEMVGEALAINHEIKRLLKSGGWYIINPALGVLRFIISIVYDRATDRQDRAVLIRQIREEIEIVEEKIQMAERNGDDRQRIELIRARQKMVKEYERITKVRYDAATRNRVLGIR